jgi:PAS domain S-box-containing protein
LKLVYKYIISFIFIVLLFILYSTNAKNSKIEEYLQIRTHEINIKYKAFYNQYKKISHMIFLTDINTKGVIDIFKDAYKSDKKTQATIRARLYQELYKTYQILQQYNIKQLHFHLPNNESFLRFHHPNRFGDNLTQIRSTVAYTNIYKQSIDSFEEGHTSNGYRFVYPLFDNDKKHIGSVEVSFNTHAFNSEFAKVFNTHTNFLTRKEIVEQKVFQQKNNNYKSTPFSNYFSENSSSLDYSHFSRKSIKIINTTQTLKSIYDNNIKEIITIIPVYNKLTNKLAGVFIAHNKESYIHSQRYYVYFLNILFALLLFLIFFFIYKNHLKQIKLNSIIEEADSGIGTISFSGKFKSVNHIYSELLGYSKEELTNLNCIDLTLQADKELAKRVFNQALKEGKISKIKKRCVTKSGEIINLEMSLKALPSGGEFIIVVNSLEDKIQLEKLNNNLQQEIAHAIDDIRYKDHILFQQSKTAAMGEMIDAIAHQWKSPLAIVKLYAQQAEYMLESKEDIDRKELIRYTYKTTEQIDHLVTTIDEFRSFFRPKTTFEEVQIETLITSVLKLMQDELRKHSIKTTIEGSVSETIHVIPNEFKHVLINLINNSKDAFNDNKIKQREIIFRINKDDSSLRLEIEDNAGGIPENVIQHIFEANVTTKEEGKGTGIGLYLAKQIVQKCDSLIEVRNVRNGVVFSIIFKKNYNSISKEIGQ